MTKLNRTTLVALFTMTSVGAMAQNGVNSPYSRYGFGMLSDRATGFNKGMGGVAQGFRDGQGINIQNPASYSGVDSLTALFDFGLTLQNGNYKMDKEQMNIRNTSIDYFAMHFRAHKNIGVALGILPISNIKYSMTSASEDVAGNEDLTSTYTYSGNGGLHEVFIGAGWRPFKPVSIGFNASYLYGEYTHGMNMSFNDANVYSIGREYTADIKTYNLDFGVQYIQPLGKVNKLVVGASYTLGHDVNNKAYRSTQTLNNAVVQTSTTDTISNAFQLPNSYAVGLAFYHSNKLRVGIDAELQQWSKCKFPNMSSTSASTDAFTAASNQLYDRKKIAAGLDWTPNAFSNSYFSRMTYKIGGYYSQSYAKTDMSGIVTDKPTEFGLSAGFTFPIMNRNLWHNAQRINVSFQWVHSNIPYLNAASMKQSALTENYLKLCLGITFSERWFFKWKVQ